jgi:hypothetical protein
VNATATEATPAIDRISDASPRFKARLAGLFYAIGGVTGGFSEFFVRDKLIVPNDAAATAVNILAQHPLYRLAGAADLIGISFEIAVVVILYDLFRPVSRTLSLIAAFFRFTHAILFAGNALTHFAPLVILGGATYLSAFKPDQLQAMAYTSLRFHSLGFRIVLVFFGIHCVLLGWLILRSTFLPRILGVLIAISGLSYLVNTLGSFLALPFPKDLNTYLLMLNAPGEVCLMLWLVTVGVNARKWQEQARAAGL